MWKWEGGIKNLDNLQKINSVLRSAKRVLNMFMQLITETFSDCLLSNIIFPACLNILASSTFSGMIHYCSGGRAMHLN